MLASDTRERIPGEEALWRYKRGAARRARGRLDLATQDLQVATGEDSTLWVRGRATVELGRIALTRGDRAGAAAAAARGQALCEQGRDPLCVADAGQLTKASRGR